MYVKIVLNQFIVLQEKSYYGLLSQIPIGSTVSSVGEVEVPFLPGHLYAALPSETKSGTLEVESDSILNGSKIFFSGNICLCLQVQTCFSCLSCAHIRYYGGQGIFYSYYFSHYYSIILST